MFGHKYEQNMEKFVLFYDVQAFEDREINNARNDWIKYSLPPFAVNLLVIETT